MKIEDVAINLLADRRCSNCGSYCEAEIETCERWTRKSDMQDYHAATLNSLKSAISGICTVTSDKDTIKSAIKNVIPLNCEHAVDIYEDEHQMNVTVKIKTAPFAEVVVIDLRKIY